MSGAARYDASQRTSTKVSGRVELDAAFAFLAAAGHLGGSFFGCHCASLVKLGASSSWRRPRASSWEYMKGSMACTSGGWKVVVGCPRAGSSVIRGRYGENSGGGKDKRHSRCFRQAAAERNAGLLAACWDFLFTNIYYKRRTVFILSL